MRSRVAIATAFCVVFCISCTAPPQRAPQPEESVEPVKAAPPPAPRVDGYLAQCNGSVTPLAEVVGPAIARVMQQGNPQPPGDPLPYTKKRTPQPGLPYRQQPGRALQDCSGNFLRVASVVAERCPNQAEMLPVKAGVPAYNTALDGAEVPAALLKKGARTTSGTARWYQSRGLFTPVYCDGDYASLSADLEAAARMIQPGTVVWYARSKKCVGHAQGLDALTDAISHMGVVQSVDRDERGVLRSYVIYHGRSSGKGSGLNRLVRKYTGSTAGVAPYGNFYEPVAGVAPIMPTT